MSQQPLISLPQGLLATPFVDEQKRMNYAWAQTFQSLFSRVNSPVSTNAPASSAGVATQGQIAFDENFLYIATGKNTWKRIALTSF